MANEKKAKNTDKQISNRESAGKPASENTEANAKANPDKKRTNIGKIEKNVRENRSKAPQLSSEEFKAFTDSFFEEADSDLFNAVTLTNETNIKEMEELVGRKSRSRSWITRMLEKEIEDAFIFGDFKQGSTSEDRLSKDDLRELTREIFDILMKEVDMLKQDGASTFFRKVSSLLKQQIEINNRRRNILKTILKERLRTHAYFYTLRILESDFESMFVSKVRNKRLKKARDAGCQELRMLAGQINEFKSRYGDVCDYKCNFADFSDSLDTDVNVDVQPFGIDNDQYFED